jgi:hypothetical protein
MLNCRGKMDFKFPTDAGCLCNSTFTTDAVVKDVVKGTPVVNNQKLSTSHKKLAYSSVHLHIRHMAIWNMFAPVL